MKAARYYRKHQIIVEEIPHREPGPGEVLIQLHYCGICGTDVHIFEGAKGSMEVEPPRILGHEFSGQVAEVGQGVTHVKLGDRVSADVNFACGGCEACAAGNSHFCEKLQGIGTALDGAFAQYITLPANAVFLVPPGVSMESAAMIEPISCCLHGMDLTGVQLGDRVMVVGCGSIGLVMLQLCRHAGASKIIAVEPSPARRKLAGELGADVLINPLEDDTGEVLRKNGVTQVDKVIDCAGLVSTAEYAVQWAGKGATVMLFGLTGPDDEMRLKPYQLFLRELTIKASFVNPCTFGRSVRLLEAGIVKTDAIITDIYPLDEIQRVFEEGLYKKNGKTLISMV